MEKMIKVNYLLGIIFITIANKFENLFVKYNMLMAGAILIAPAINLVLDSLIEDMKKIFKN